MTLHNTKLYITLFLILAVSLPIKAQIQLGGLADFELRKGGADSSPYVNQTPTDKWNLYNPYIRLFASADISDNWFITSVLQSDYYKGTELSSPFFAVINLNWTPDDNDFTITAGRFVTPYGKYSERYLSSENPFVHLPLSHASGLPVSRGSGIIPNAANYGNTAYNGLTMVYQRMYSQGIGIKNQVGNSDWLRYNLAATLAPASSFFETAQYNIPSFTGRFIIQPKVWGQLGLSFSTGPFMDIDAANAVANSDPTSFRQTLLGTDVEISYRYYTFMIEYNWTQWKAPYVNQTGPKDIFNTSVNHISGEAVVNLPFWVGSYVGVRYEQLISGDLKNTTSYSNDEVWTYDRERLEIILGYKLHRNITLKTSYLYSTDTGPNLDDDVLALQLSVAF